LPGDARGLYDGGMTRSEPNASKARPPGADDVLRAFDSPLVDRIRVEGNVWRLKHGEILLPREFGFCRGVKRALVRVEETCNRYAGSAKRIYLLGQIIHNPYVNEHFHRRGVVILSNEQRQDVERFIGPEDCAVIPAFGVPLPIERRLERIGCEIVDTSCGDVRRLWKWAERAAGEGYGVLIFGKGEHDETVVTRSRLDAAGGKYVVAGSIEQVRRVCDRITGRLPAGRLREGLPGLVANVDSLEPFGRLAQVSQTTMLYDDTMVVRDIILQAFVERYGREEASRRLQFQPTVCRATQDRQAASVELCSCGADVVIVVGGFGSSNTRNLYRLAREHTCAYFIEGPEAVASAEELHTIDAAGETPTVARDWLPKRRPLRLGVLAGASTPEVVVGDVMERLAELMEAGAG